MGEIMVLVTFSATTDLDEVPEGQSDEFYALAMQEHIAKTALEELDYNVDLTGMEHDPARQETTVVKKGASRFDGII